MRPHFLLALVVVALCVAAAPADAQRLKLRFKANLLPKNEVPPLNKTATQARGTFTLAFSRVEPRNATWTLSLNKLTGQTVQAGHIHIGAAGQSGPVITFLFSGGTGGFGNKLTSAFLTENVPLSGPNTFGRVFALTSNKTELYINIHSTEFPGGFIRGQLK